VGARLALAVGLVALVAPGAAAARTALLPSPTTPLDTKLPLGAAASATAPPLVPANAPVENRQVVFVDVRPDGTVLRVRVRQVLTLRGTGDFFFQVPAPVKDVHAAPGSQGEPGLRQNAILWQGFSNRRRVLAADVELDPAAAAVALPLAIERRDGKLLLRNVTAVRARGFAAAADPVAIRRTLAAIGRHPPEPRTIEIHGPVEGRNVVVEAPLHVLGSVRSPDNVGRPLNLALGGFAPQQLALAASEGSKLNLEVTPVLALPELRPAPPGTPAPELVLRASTAMLRVARVHQYRGFLSAPGVGPTSTVYRYRTVAAQPAAQEGGASGDGKLPLVLLLAGAAVLASGGLVVAWAHS
jgi:hypothetical protein